MRAIGHEFGATTGRPRRCGWIDLPQLLYTIMINGVTQVIITKLDVLNDFDEIWAGETYQYDGIATTELPFDLCTTEMQINYTHHPGWNQDLQGINSFHQLPDKAKTYLTYLENQLKTKISMISTGPERSELIVR